MLLQDAKNKYREHKLKTEQVLLCQVLLLYTRDDSCHPPFKSHEREVIVRAGRVKKCHGMRCK